MAWYVTGRFYAKGATLLDAGYFLHIQGIAAPLFADAISEQTAMLTFASAPFTAPSITNGDLNIGLDTTGTFRVFVRTEPGASFDDPATFTQGQCVATFARVSLVPTVRVSSLLLNVFTARLISAHPFELAGTHYDFHNLVGPAISQWGTAATEIVPPPEGYSSAVPFVGSAIRAG